MKKVDVGKDFYHRLANRDRNQGTGLYTAKQFREKYLAELDNQNSWRNPKESFIEFDFTNVDVIAPSFANEAFAYFTQYADKDTILKVIKLINISDVKKQIIEVELEAGRKGRK